MKRSKFYLILAGATLVVMVVGKGSTDLTVSFWACIILSALAEQDERR